MEVIVLDEGRIVAQVEALDGVTTMYVLNGAWDGVLDWGNKCYWADKYPDSKIKFTNWRQAVRGQDPYYGSGLTRKGRE